MSKKIIIIGGVAGGATAAARARRLDENAEIILFERNEHISFANCGLPYYIGGIIKKRKKLMVTSIDGFRERYNIDIRNFSEVIAIDRKKKTIEVKNTNTDETYTETYGKIILSPGANPVKPPIEGISAENIFTLRNIPDTDRIKAYIDENSPESAVVVGGGFIGLEMAENLAERGVKVTIVEMLEQVMPPIDYEIASIVHSHLVEKGVHLELGNPVREFVENGKKTTVVTQNNKKIDCDMVILSIGITPENTLAKQAGLEMNERGGIKTDEAMSTSDPDIFAAGDAIETIDFIFKNPVMLPLAGPANRQGRIAADNALGRKSSFSGALGTAVVKVFDLIVASTGMSEKSLKQSDIAYEKSYTHSFSHATYYPGAEGMTIKLLFSSDKGEILGAQIVGKDGVDKRIDVIATAIHGRMTVYDLENLELAYAPPFSSAKDPVNIAGNVAANILKKDVDNIYWHDLDGLDADENILIDLRTRREIKRNGAVEGAVHIPVDSLREKLGELDRNKTYILFCAVGLRGYVAYRILSQNGFKAKNFSGGFTIYKSIGSKKSEK